MSRDPNTGTYTLPQLPNDGEDIDASDVNGPFRDIEAALNGTLPTNKGGTGATSPAGARTAISAQEASAKLTAIAGMAWADNRILAGAGPNTIKGLTFRDRDDLGGSSADAAGVASEQSVKAYVDGRTGAAGSALGLAKTSDDISFANGQATIRDGRVGYDELDAGTGTTGQALVKTAAGIGFATPKRWTRLAPIDAAATMEWTGLPAGIEQIRLAGNFSRSKTGGTQSRNLSIQLGPDGDGDGFQLYGQREDAADAAVFPPAIWEAVRLYGNVWRITAAPGGTWAGTTSFGGVGVGGGGGGVGGGGVGGGVGAYRTIDGELSSVKIRYWGYAGSNIWTQNRNWGGTFSGQAHLAYI